MSSHCVISHLWFFESIDKRLELSSIISILRKGVDNSICSKSKTHHKKSILAINYSKINYKTWWCGGSVLRWQQFLLIRVHRMDQSLRLTVVNAKLFSISLWFTPSGEEREDIQQSLSKLESSCKLEWLRRSAIVAENFYNSLSIPALHLLHFEIDAEIPIKRKVPHFDKRLLS